MIETLAQILAGLGLFFAGLELLSANLRGMTSRRFQRAVGGWTATPGKGFAWGALAGALTQSSAVVTFIVVGLLVAGMTVVVRGLPLIVGSNLGAGALLFIVSLDFGPAVLVLTGLVGLGVTIERLRPWRQGLWALFGIALLFVGLSLLKEGTAPLADSETVRSLLESTAGSHLLAFLIGAVLTVVVNSSVAIGVLSMSLMASGVLSFETTAMVIYGTNLGSSATTYLLSMKLRGEARQLAMYQVAFNVVGCLVFLPLFFIETMTSLPLSLALLEWLSDDPATRVAWAYLLFNASAALLLMPTLGPSARLLGRLWPRTPAEDLARPAFIGDFALQDPDLAIELTAREHHRIFQAVADLLAPLAEAGAGPAQGARPADAEAPRALLRATDGFLEDLGRLTMSAGQLGRYYRRIEAQRHLESLTDDVARFTATVEKLLASDGGRHLGQLLGDSLHAILHTCAEALAREATAEDRAFALDVTTDRGPAIRSVRESYLGERSETDDAEQAATMLAGISLFERVIWQAHALVAQQAEEAEDGAQESLRAAPSASAAASAGTQA